MQDLITFISHHRVLAYAFVSILVLLMIVEYFRLKRNNIRVDTAKAIQLINRENAVVIDIRPNESYRKGHIIDSVSLTSREIGENPKKIEKYRTKPIIIVCSGGIESQKIAALLLKRGYNAYSISGGISAWSQANMPLIKE